MQEPLGRCSSRRDGTGLKTQRHHLLDLSGTGASGCFRKRRSLVLGARGEDVDKEARYITERDSDRGAAEQGDCGA
jgi:hypothetical protein